MALLRNVPIVFCSPDCCFHFNFSMTPSQTYHVQSLRGMRPSFLSLFRATSAAPREAAPLGTPLFSSLLESERDFQNLEQFGVVLADGQVYNEITGGSHHCPPVCQVEKPLGMEGCQKILLSTDSNSLICGKTTWLHHNNKG